MDGQDLVGGRYRLGYRLGRGGMGEVRLGLDTKLSRSVAVKQLHGELALDPSARARFEREARAAASLNHPAIVAVFDSGEDIDPETQKPVPFIVMELVYGQTLRSLQRQGQKLPPERALQVTQGVLAALAHSHAAGIIHQDIKPANVMLTSAGEVKLMDFGIAQAAADADVTLPSTEGVLGTAKYLSPERIRGGAVDGRSDIYATGCLLYELLAGRPPFLGETALSISCQHLHDAPVPPSEVNPAVDGRLDAIVLTALAKEPADRFQSADEMSDEIDLVLGAPTPAMAAPAVAVAAASAPAAVAAASAPAAVVPASAPAAVVPASAPAAVVAASAPAAVAPALGPTAASAPLAAAAVAVSVGAARAAGLAPRRGAAPAPRRAAATPSRGSVGAAAAHAFVRPTKTHRRASLVAAGLAAVLFPLGAYGIYDLSRPTVTQAEGVKVSTVLPNPTSQPGSTAPNTVPSGRASEQRDAKTSPDQEDSDKLDSDASSNKAGSKDAAQQDRGTGTASRPGSQAVLTVNLDRTTSADPTKPSTVPTPARPDQPDAPVKVAPIPDVKPTEPARPEQPAKPAPSEPAPSKPTPSKPAPQEPEPSKPAPQEPEPSKPAPSKPAAPSRPAPSKPDKDNRDRDRDVPESSRRVIWSESGSDRRDAHRFNVDRSHSDSDRSDRRRDDEDRWERQRSLARWDESGSEGRAYSWNRSERRDRHSADERGERSRRDSDDRRYDRDDRGWDEDSQES